MPFRRLFTSFRPLHTCSIIPDGEFSRKRPSPFNKRNVGVFRKRTRFWFSGEIFGIGFGGGSRESLGTGTGDDGGVWLRSPEVTLSLQHHKGQVRGLAWARASCWYAFERPSHVRVRLLSAMRSIEKPITVNLSNRCLIPGCKRRFCNASLTAAFAIASFSAGRTCL